MQLTATGELLLTDNDYFENGQVMLTHPEGDLLIDHGYEIGLFDSSSDREFQYSSIIIP